MAGLASTSVPPVSIGMKSVSDYSHMHTSTFLSMGPPDVILHFDDCDLAAHAEVLKVYSSVLRDVVRGTLCNLNGNADSEEFLPSIIPMGAGDSLAWGQSLTALYSFVEDVPEGVLWSNILVSLGRIPSFVNRTAKVQVSSSSFQMIVEGWEQARALGREVLAIVFMTQQCSKILAGRCPVLRGCSRAQGAEVFEKEPLDTALKKTGCI